MIDELLFLIRVGLIPIALLPLEQLNKTRKENTQRAHRATLTRARA